MGGNFDKKTIMDNSNDNKSQEIFNDFEKRHTRGKIFGGILVVTVGTILLAREIGVEIPHWILSWKTLLIAIGLLTGIKHKFKNYSWLILVLIGSIFLVSDLYPELYIKPLLWPVLIIVIGLFIIFKPHRQRHTHENRFCRNRHRYKNPSHIPYSYVDSKSDEEFVDWVAVMGGIKKTVLSKNFKGGEITVVFGGAEINFSQADFEDKAIIEITQVFGGTKLIIPAHWEIKSELVSVFGNIEDKRPIQPNTNSNKIRILKGNTFFGGIDIKSY